MMPPDPTPAGLPSWVAIARELGFPGFVVLVLLWFVYSTGTFAAPLAVRLVEATETAARASVANGELLRTMRDRAAEEHDHIGELAQEARDEARAARVMLAGGPAYNPAPSRSRPRALAR